MFVKLPQIVRIQEVTNYEDEKTRQSKSAPKQRPSKEAPDEKINKVRPLFVAKKLSQTDFSNNKEEQTPLISSRNELGRIIEEHSEIPFNMSQNMKMSIDKEKEEEDDNMLNESEFNGVETTTTTNVNIFESEMFRNSKYREIFKGPQYEMGKIVRHSIVSKPEFFINHMRRMARLAAFEKDSSPVSRDSRITQSMKSLQGSSPPRFIRSESKKPTFSKLSLLTFRKDANNNNTISRKELFEEISKLRERQDTFYSEVEKRANRMALRDKLAYTREKRTLEKFGKVQQHWEKSTERINSQIGRAKSESVVTKSESFREKLETADAFEIVKSDEQKFGNAFWYLNLRKDKNRKENRGAFLKDDIPIGFQTAIMDRPKSSVEIIRKPGSMRKITENSSINKLSQISTGDVTERLSNRTSQEYLNRKLNESASFIMQIKANGNGFDDLELVGESKLNNEIDALVSDQNYKGERIPALMLKNKNSVNGVKEEKEETFIESYDKRRLARQGNQIILSSRLP